VVADLVLIQKKLKT